MIPKSAKTFLHKKARESEHIAHPAYSGSRIAFYPRISNTVAHAVCTCD